MENQKKKKKSQNRSSSVNHALTNPFQVKWPTIEDKELIGKASILLKSSFTGVKLQTKAKLLKADRLHKRQTRTPKARVMKPGKVAMEGGKRKSMEETLCNPSKVRKLEQPLSDSCNKDTMESDCAGQGLDTTANKLEVITDEQITTAGQSVVDDIISLKKDQFVVGINSVTRCLEQNTLRAVLVCLSVRPVFVTHHINTLSATRSCPVIALPNLSELVAPLLGIKSVLAVGFKKIPKNGLDPFNELVSFIIDNGVVPPSVLVPCVQQSIDSVGIMEETTEESSHYLPVQIKAVTPTDKR